MNSPKFLYILLFVLLVVAALLLLKDKTSTLRKREAGFGVSGEENISKVQIVKDTVEVVIDNESGSWKVNHTFAPRQEALSLLMNTLQRLEVVAPVSRSYKVLANKKLRNSSKRVDIYTGKRLLKSFYVNYDTSKLNATIMMLVNAKEPYIVKIKGYDLKDISKIFSLDPKFWRNNTLFNYTPADIKVIKILYPFIPGQSFSIINPQNGEFQLISAKSNKNLIEDADLNSIKDYLYFFTGIKFRYPNDYITLNNVTNMKFAEITVTDKDNKSINISLFRKPVLNQHENNKEFDLNICYGLINNEEELIELRYYDIDPVLRDLNDFVKK